ncbi:putative disease resistance protein RGA2 [Iris pallida]|uniref:Disease resistance protein RGA2 n=2 Tax=Iris pallida TaxID=29817 RepID=A0AAX6HU09_IRIPA|nr:putative disease resistance protein RGA2 [Iris pallida]
MAEAAVLSAFIQVLLDKLSAAALSGLSELRSLRRVKEDLEGMATTLSMIQAVIEDAETKQVRDKATRIWLASLKGVACEIDEVLDDFRARSSSSSSRPQPSPEGRRAKKVLACLFPCPCRTTLLHCNMSNRIRDIRKRLDRTVRDRDMLGLQAPQGTTMGPAEPAARPQSTSLVDDANVFGREEDRDNIVEILLKVDTRSSRLNVSVLPVVGMGGLGKTTLTQLVYNDSRVKDHFQLRLWICVSESFDVMKLTKETIESTSVSSFMGGYSANAPTNMNKVQETLSAELKGKRFLLVLDDVWNEDPEKWYSFCGALVGAGRGSKIIVTTRNENVGRIMSGLPPYRLAQLSDGDCWRLFRSCAFVDGDSTGHPNLEKIGKEIVKKLKGLPLAAKALGSLLYEKTDEEDWRNVLRSEIWELPPDKNNILPALRLSYNHLPPRLKQCFSFCAVFHKDYVFEKKKLVQIWMALGFVQPQGRTRLEDVGSGYFDDLLKRSFFQAHKGNYVMHDAMHDLAQLISSGACLRLEEGGGGVKHAGPDAHHVSYSCSHSGLTSFGVFSDFRRLQSLLLLHGYKSRVAPIPKDLFLGQKWLRVLDLNRRDIADIPSSIGNLKQLRYLGLQGTGIKTLPSSLGGLYNLQTLKLKYCDALSEIPEGVTKLVNLRHLEASATLISKIGRIGRLTALQELEEFAVSNDSRFKIHELRDMGELRGHLSIRSLENVADGEEANQARLDAKAYLGVLEFVWADDRRVSYEDELRNQDVLQGLRPHVEIKEITVRGYSGAEFPRWLGSPAYSFLETIHLSNCRRCKLLPSLGQLPFLRYLDIGAFGVTTIGREFSGGGEIKGGFPALKELVIADMPDLEEWLTDDDGCLFPCLTDLEISDCPRLRGLPSIPPTVTRLRISEAGITTLPPVRTDRHSVPSSLSSLHVNECPNLRSLRPGLLGRQELLPALEKLTITDCEELRTLPADCFGSLVSLRSLHLYNCSRLAVGGQELGVGALSSSLEDFEVASCSGLIEQLLVRKLSALPRLTNLKIVDCDGLECFPDSALPASLQTLAINNCAGLRSLPEDLREVRSLETLVISNCPRMATLPEKGLPEMLQELHIRECPLLKERCEEGRGRDWEKIAHIPRVHIDIEWFKQGVHV